MKKIVTLFALLVIVMTRSVFAGNTDSMVTCYCTDKCINSGGSLLLKPDLHHNFTDNISYQWQKLNSNNYWEDIPGATEREYLAHAGVYRVRITEHGDCANKNKSFCSPPFVVAYCGTDLPVTLIDFNGKIVGQKVIINWVTSQELNIDHFEVEKSYDLQSFVTVDTAITTGNSSVIKNYTAEDGLKTSNNNVIYYRLRTVDKDQSVTFSKIITIKNNMQAPSGSVAFYPNPATSSITLMSSDSDGKDFIITDVSGKKMISGKIVNKQINVTSLPKGMYFISIDKSTPGKLSKE